MKKAIFTLNINYAKEITDITYPLIKQWSDKIGADFIIIDERKYPDYPITYEKLQIYEKSKELGLDWAIFIDSDCLIHPDLFDLTTSISKDTVLFVGKDYAPIRFEQDEYFLRDGRNIGTCGWFSMASNLCFDLWKPLDDLDIKTAISRCYPTKLEEINKITKEHLIDDYVVSRNIAKYGLKHKVFEDVMTEKNINGDYFYHEYLINTDEKIRRLKKRKEEWGY